MAKKSMILKQQAEPKFSSRRYNRCKICGRPHAYLRDYGVCRICFRELAYKGQIPGVRKASWEGKVVFKCKKSLVRPRKMEQALPARIPRIPPNLERVKPVTSYRRM